MSNPNNSTELGGRKELNVKISDDFARFDAGFIIVTTDSKSLENNLKTVATMKLRSELKDMKLAGKLKPQTKQMIEMRRSNKER